MITANEKRLLPYWKQAIRRPQPRGGGPQHIFFAVCDHFEPLGPNGSKSQAVCDQRVQNWLRRWPELAGRFRDCEGRSPCHSIFYPAETAEGASRYVPMLRPLLETGRAELEIHLHHRDDNEAGLRQALCEFRDYLHSEHGILGTDAEGRPRFGFIHGNWALCNSRSDGDWCGVDNELSVLLDSGCYADFTFPSIPSETQPRRFCNDLYLSRDLGGRPRSHDFGRRAALGLQPTAEELLLVQGPVGINWRSRKFGLIPRIENADLSGSNPPTDHRMGLWLRSHIHVAGRPEWQFIKLHTHGCVEANTEVLLGGPLMKTLSRLCDSFNDGRRFALHFVSAREMYNLAAAAMSGLPSDAVLEGRDFQIRPPGIRQDL